MMRRISSNQQVIFDDSLYVLLGSSIDYHTASQSKIVAYISARELDFLVTTKELTDYYSKSFPLCDLEEFLPEHLLTLLENQFYYAKTSDGTTKAPDLRKRQPQTRLPPIILWYFPIQNIKIQ